MYTVEQAIDALSDNYDTLQAEINNLKARRATVKAVGNTAQSAGYRTVILEAERKLANIEKQQVAFIELSAPE